MVTLATSKKVMDSARIMHLRMTLGPEMHFCFIEVLNEYMNERVYTYYVRYNLHFGAPEFDSPYRKVFFSLRLQYYR
jgi:hypothetical protein